VISDTRCLSLSPHPLSFQLSTPLFRLVKGIPWIFRRLLSEAPPADKIRWQVSLSFVLSILIFSFANSCWRQQQQRKLRTKLGKQLQKNLKINEQEKIIFLNILNIKIKITWKKTQNGKRSTAWAFTGKWNNNRKIYDMWAVGRCVDEVTAN